MANQPTTEKVYQTPLARISYPFVHKLYTPTPLPGQQPKAPQCSATLIFNIPEIMAGSDQDKQRLAALLEAAQKMMKDRFPKETWEGPFMDRTTGCHSPWLDGGAPQYRDKDGLGEGKRFLRTASNRIVPCVGRNPEQVITAEDNPGIYPGCFVYARIVPYAYDPRRVNPTAKWGVGFGIRAIQFVKNGPRLDDSVDASTAFDALDGDTIEGDGMASLAALFGKAA